MSFLATLARWFRPVPESPAPEFTPRARQLVALARREATHGSAAQIDTPHLLLALLRLEKCSGHEVLKRLGANAADLQASLAAGGDLPPSGGHRGKLVPTDARLIPYSNNLKKTLAWAAKEARQLNHRYVGTDHLLLGLLRVNARTTAKALASQAIDQEKVRQTIRLTAKDERPEI